MSTESSQDQALIRRLNAGDSSAFAPLYFKYRDFVVRLARRFTGNDEDALDVLQETFAYVHRKFPGFTLTCAMTSFLYPVVRHLSLHAKRKRHLSLAIDESALDIPDTLSPDQANDDLRDLLKRLEPIHRQVILMRFVDDLTIDEIADALSIPSGTVKSRLHHAIAKLRDDSWAKKFFDQS